ncbi:hypothetical protein ScPMuIL_001966 [Solemya velum]
MSNATGSIMSRIKLKKIPLIIICAVFLLTVGLYIRYFKHGAPEEILEANRRNFGSPKRKTHVDDTELQWMSFLETNHFVKIGGVYDSCEEEVRKTVGTSILLPDGKGGVKTRTYINMTLDIDVTEGVFYMEVKYNSQDLYSSQWDLCTLDEDFDDRLIFCPLKAGLHSWKKERKVPGYLPKGRYETKAWVTDQTEEIIACGMSDFIL